MLRGITAARERHGARIVESSVQSNHIHLIVEAAGRAELIVGLRALGVRLARAINWAFSRRGRAIADRYHARALETPLAVRTALRYVLSNGRHHAARRGPVPTGILDGCSSARWFEGWKDAAAAAFALLVPPAGPPARGGPPVAAAQSWLLRVGWRRHGLIDPNEIPGPSRPS